MATISRSTTWSSGDTLTAAALNAEFNVVFNDYNGGITNANINGSAAIAYSKLSLTSSVVNADISGSAAIATSKINTTFPSGTILGTTDTQTLTNKRITKRVGTTTSSSAPTPAADDVDMYTVTALAEGATFGAPTGTPTNGQTLLIRILDNGTARSLAFNAIYRFSADLSAPSTTVVSKTIYLGFVYNSAATKWDCVAKLDNF